MSSSSSSTTPSSEELDNVFTMNIIQANDLAEGRVYYANFMCIDRVTGQEQTSNIQQTKQVSRTNNPVWGKEIILGMNEQIHKKDKFILKVFSRESGSSNKMPHVLGAVVISASDFPENSHSATDKWYELEQTSGQSKKYNVPQGKVNISVSITDTTEARKIMALRMSRHKRNTSLDEEGEPNELQIIVQAAQNVPAVNKTLLGTKLDTSDPFVEIQTVNTTKNSSVKTTVKKEDLNPVWNESFNLSAVRNSIASPGLTISIYDYDNKIKKTFIGKHEIGSLSQYSDKQAHELKLNFKNKEGKPIVGMTLTLVLRYVYNPDIDSSDNKNVFDKGIGFFKSNVENISKHINKVINRSEDSDTEEEDEEEDIDEAFKEDNKANDKEGDSPESEDEQKAEKEKAEQAKKDMETLSNYKVVRGDYQVSVHIIECRELKAMDLQGTSDPVVCCELFNNRQYTQVHESTLSCVFDETFIFNKKDVDPDAFSEMSLKVSVLDADGGVRHELIGEYLFDLQYVYFNKDHEIYKQWIALINTKDAISNAAKKEEDKDNGVAGYLKLSVSVIGPNDKYKIHDLEKEEIEEAKQSAAGGEFQVLMPPTVKLKTDYFKISIYKIEHLVMMDRLVTGIGGCDPFFEVSFATTAPIRTPSKSIQNVASREFMNIDSFNMEMWIPRISPTVAKKLKLNLYDYDAKGSELIGHYNIHVSDIEKWSKNEPKWINLYGGNQTSVTEAAAKDVIPGHLFEKKVDGQIFGETWNTFYINHSHLAPMFRGRVLLSAVIEDSLPNKKIPKSYRRGEGIVRPIKNNDIARLKPPKTQRMFFNMYLYSGAAISKIKGVDFGDIIGKGKQKVTVNVEIGKYQNRLSSPGVVNNGYVEFMNHEDTESGIIQIELNDFPIDIDQMPDVIVSLCTTMEGKTALVIDKSSSGSSPFAYFRISTSDLIEHGFKSSEPKWHHLHKERVINLLGDKDSAGYLLASIGMGKENEWNKVKNQWALRADSYRSTLAHPDHYKLHVFTYVARNLPSADSNGLLDPYLKYRCANQCQTSEKFRKNVNPVFNSCTQFDLVIGDPQYAPLCVIDVYDEDFIGGIKSSKTKVGTICLDPKAFDQIMKPVDKNDFMNLPPPPKPIWYPVLKEDRGEYVTTEGEILISAQLIKVKYAGIDFDPRGRKVELPGRFSRVELTLLGCRDLKPYLFRPMSEPFIEFEVPCLSGVPGKVSSSTSKKPEPSNPNFNERLNLDVMLPVDEDLAPFITLILKDVRMGGYLKPICGVAKIPLKDRLPWGTNYRRRSSLGFSSNDSIDIQLSTANLQKDDNDELNNSRSLGSPRVNAALKKADTEEKQEESMEASLLGTDSIKSTDEVNANTKSDIALEDIKITSALVVNSNPVLVTDTDCEKESDDMFDTGAGVFGAMSHFEKEDFADMEKKNDDQQFDEDDAMALAEGSLVDKSYLEKRETIGEELEEAKQLGPFTVFTLGRGYGKKRIEVGQIKALVRVLDLENNGGEEHEDKAFDLKLLQTPQEVEVRLYVLTAKNLAAKDPTNPITGQPGRSDPYLICKLGKDVFNDRKNHLDDVTDADFYKLYTFKTSIPGNTTLDIKCKDWDFIGTDDLIGRTVIDLEDRWFDKKWKELGKENRTMPEDIKDNLDNIRWDTKPLETRALKVPSSKAPQGTLDLWVDILSAEEAKLYPPDDVHLPPIKNFEVRVVVWKTKDVVPMDYFEQMNDLFIRVSIEGAPHTLETDTHWRCKKGKGSFNYRLKFPIELGEHTRAMKFPQLKLQMWDRDILKWNDFIGETQLDLRNAFRRAYKEENIVKLFQKKKKSRKKVKQDGKDKQIKAQKADTTPVMTKQQSLAKISTDDGGDSGAPNTTGAGDIEMSKTNSSKKLIESTDIKSTDIKSTDNDSSSGNILPDSHQIDIDPTLSKVNLKDNHDEKEEKKGIYYWCCKSKEDYDSDDEEAVPLKSGDADNSDFKEFIDSLKEASGLYDMDPPNSTWLAIDKADKKTGKREPMGSVAISVEIWPQERADADPVGSGRNDPNHSPFLPPPVGRIKFSLNPFVMGSELLGPVLCGKITCCLFCIAAVLLLIFCQPVLNLAIALIF